MALDAVLTGKDVELDAIYICPVCGATMICVTSFNRIK